MPSPSAGAHCATALANVWDAAAAKETEAEVNADNVPSADATPQGPNGLAGWTTLLGQVGQEDANSSRWVQHGCD
jgi:hypothetical protein